MKKKNSKSKKTTLNSSKRKLLFFFGMLTLLGGLLFSNFGISSVNNANAADQGLAQPNQAGKFVMFGNAYTGDGLAPGWKNGSLFNGVNTWNIIEKEQVYAGVHSLSWMPAAPFERGWIIGTSPLNLSQYQYLNFYAKSTEPGQRLEVGFSDASGNVIGNFIPMDSMGGPLQNDRWQLYSAPISQFGATGQVYGLVFRDMNGAPQKKIYFDEIELSISPGTAPVISSSLGQPPAPTTPPKPKGPFYPQISPWVFIIPGLIIVIAIFFE